MSDPIWGDREATLRDHSATSELYRTLVDVRFKLLTFVPTITALAVGIVTVDKTATSGETWLLVGAIGLISTLALVVYEVRNSLIHDCSIHRMRHLERVLGFRPSSPGDIPRGMFGERGERSSLFGLFLVQHDRALSMIYGVVAGAWAWVVLTGVETRWDVPWVDGTLATLTKLIIPIAVALAIAEEVARLGARDRPPSLIYTLESVAPAARRLTEPADAGACDAEGAAAAIMKAVDLALGELPPSPLNGWPPPQTANVAAKLNA